MFEYLLDFPSWMAGDSFYWFCAFTGTLLFAIQFILFGFADFDEIDDGGNFKWLSRQAITGFLMMFGWSALTCQKEFNIEGFPKIMIAFVSGVMAVLTSGFIFKAAKKLHSEGTVFKIEDTIGQEAVVYLRIPSDGTGKVSVCIENFVRELDACSIENYEIPSFSIVKIINKVDDNTVLVETL